MSTIHDNFMETVSGFFKTSWLMNGVNKGIFSKEK